jgi:D-3-phosphoglycerate dehydrogenase
MAMTMGQGHERWQVVVTDGFSERYDIEEARFAAAGVAGTRYLRLKTAAEVVEQCADADVIIKGWIELPREALEELPRVKAIIRAGIGVDMVDIAAATDLGILVCNTATYCLDEVSNQALVLLLALNRQLMAHVARIREGGWAVRDVPHPRRLKGQILGLVGLGNIGRQVAAKAAGFGLKVVAHDPFVQADQVEVTNVGAVPLLALNEMLGLADIVSLHCPLSPATRHLIGAPQFAQMRPGSMLINTARGGLVDQDALVEALRSGHLAAAGLDVTTPEPLPNPHPLRELPNVLVTPHTASISVESGIDCRNATVDHAVALLGGRVPTDVMNRAVLASGRWRGAADRITA